MKTKFLLFYLLLAFHMACGQVRKNQITKSDNLFIVQKNSKENKFGFINSKGDLIIDCDFDEVFDFKNGFAIVRKASWLGVINTKGEIVVDLKYEYISNASEGLFTFQENGTFGFLNSSGEKVIENIYDDANNFSEGLALVNKDGKYGYINKAGKTIIPFKFDKANSFSEGLAKVTLKNKENGIDSGFIDKSGKTIIPFKYYSGWDKDDNEEGFKEGLVGVSLDSASFGFINKLGSMVIKPKYLRVNKFNEGLALVLSEDSKLGFIDKQGKLIIPFNFSEAEDFSYGMAKVTYFGQPTYFFIDKKGNKVLDSNFTNLDSFYNGYAKVKQGIDTYYIDNKMQFFHSFFAFDMVENVTNYYLGNNVNYTGQLINNKPNGYGKWVSTDGEWYEGQFKNGKENGRGTLRRKDGIRYYGNFVNGQPNGVFTAKSWTMGGLIANEWYAEYDHGKLTSSQKTKDDFDKFLNGTYSESNSSFSKNNSSESEFSNKKTPNVVKFESEKGGGVILGTNTEKYYVKFSDDVSGYLYKYYKKDGGKWAVSNGVSADEFETKEEGLKALYEYKK